ncbi:UNVERIFIED_CONTAM: amino acid ABC transporter permease, partial [Bacillus amyloliquefaciens DSM 7 = ATCC 23350]
LPVLISQLVVVLKDTAIGYVITFLELVRQGVQMGTAYGNLLPALIVVALLIIAVNFTLSWVATRVEARMRRSRRGASPLEAEALEQEGVPGAKAV